MFKIFFILATSKRTTFKYPKWKLSSQIHSGAFVKIIARKLKKNPELRNSGILVLLSKDKISELRNLEILSSLKIPS